MLSARTIEIVKATAPVVATHAEAITRRFYLLMFAAHPELFAYFNHAHQQSGRQQRALADAVIAYATHIENIPILLPAVELIAQKHCSLGIQPAHYPIVGQYLLAAIRDVLGKAATEEIIAAWAEAYGVLAEIFITREAEIYRQQASQSGGWNGYRPFVVTKKTPECETVTSFHLQPADGRPLADFLPGQYITIKINPDKLHPAQANQATTTGGSALLIAPRNYSLSDRPGQEHYRISVKRETSLNGQSADGVVSNHLHDQVQVGDILEVGPPCGEFILDPALAATRPLVFIAGGVGVTPLLSMLKSVVHHGPRQPIHFVQAATNRPRHAFHEELATLAHNCPLLSTHVRYSQPLAADRMETRHHSEGTVDRAFLDSLIAKSPPGAEFYFCGPAPFMQAIVQRLQDHQIEETRIHFEFFGPKRQLTAA